MAKQQIYLFGKYDCIRYVNVLLKLVDILDAYIT